MFDESWGVIGLFLMVVFGIIGVFALGSLALQFLPLVGFKILVILFSMGAGGLGFYLFSNTDW